MSWLKKRLPKKRWKRVLVYIFSVMLILLAADMILVQCWRRIEVGPDTTRIAGPMTPAGYPDYIADLNAKLSAGVTPENNAVPMLIQLIKSSELSDDWRKETYGRLGLPSDSNFKGIEPFEIWAKTNAPKLDHPEEWQSLNMPWTRAEHPELGRWLDDQASTMMLVHAATKHSRYYFPLVGASGTTHNPPGEMIRLLLPTLGPSRYAAHELAARSMMRLAEGDAAGFEADVLAALKLARLQSQSSTLIEYLVAVGIENIGQTTLQNAVASGHLDAAAFARLRKNLADLPPLHDASFVIDVSERYNFLDSICLVSDGGPAALQSLTVLSAPGDPVPTHSFSNRATQLFLPLHYNEMMRVANSYFDRLTAAIREPDYAHRKSELDAVDRDIVALKNRNIVVQFTDPAGLFVCILIPSLTRVAEMQAATVETAHLTDAALALAQYHLDHNAYPETLAALALPAEISTDLFTNAPLIYRRTAAGYLLYSVGPDGKDDGGITRKEAKGKPGWDIVVRTER